MASIIPIITPSLTCASPGLRFLSPIYHHHLKKLTNANAPRTPTTWTAEHLHVLNFGTELYPQLAFLATKTKQAAGRAVCQSVQPRDDFTLQKTVNVLPGPHGLTNSLGSCGTGHTGFRRCGQCHTNQGCLSIRVAGAALRANLEGPPAEKYRFCTRAASRRSRDNFTIHECPRCGQGHTH